MFCFFQALHYFPWAQPPSSVPQRHQYCPRAWEQEQVTLGRYSNLDKSQHALNQSFGVSSLQLPCHIYSLKQHCTRTVFIFPWQKVKCYIFKTENLKQTHHRRRSGHGTKHPTQDFCFVNIQVSFKTTSSVRTKKSTACSLIIEKN